MPRVIINSATPARRSERLVQRLAKELTEPGESPQPLIVERLLSTTKSRHVHVIWDQWGDLVDEERSAVITEAYAKAEGDEAALNITVALGLRPEDAIIFGVLPFKVVPKREHDAERTDYRVAFEKEVGHTVLGDGARELRYANLEEAEQAIKRLKRFATKTSWAIVREDEHEE